MDESLDPVFGCGGRVLFLDILMKHIFRFDFRIWTLRGTNYF